MRIKYKAPGMFFWRRFWRISEYGQTADGRFWAVSRAKKRKIFFPATAVVEVIGYE